VTDVSRRAFCAVIAAGVLSVGSAGAAQAATRPGAKGAVFAAALAPILTRNGSSLLVRGKTRRLSGVNAYWLGLNDNVRDSTGAPTLPSHAELTAALSGMRNMGASLVRAHSVGISAGTARSYETARGVYSDANLDSADWAVYQAKQQDIMLMVPVTDQWNYFHGGKGVFVHWAYQQNSSGLSDVPAPAHLFDADGAEKGSKLEDQFYSTSAAGLRIRALFKDYLSHWLNHVNRYTGLAYKDDPTIAIIETGNEIYSATAEWTADIATYIKSIAPGKLVADGSAATGLGVANSPGLSAANVDIVGGHYYAQDASWAPAPIMTLASQLDRDVSAAQAAGKAFILGEYPWTRADIAQWYAKVEGNAAVAADMMWTFVGGTEVHGGSFGSDDYSVHWPYQGVREQQYAPALARHISAVSGIPLSSATTASSVTASTGATSSSAVIKPTVSTAQAAFSR
jgi:mannan endo-1,4-beta-mannosidase